MSIVATISNFFSSGTWFVIRNLALFFVVVFWIALAYWVYKDARRRIEDPWLVAMSTVLGLMPPFLGVLIYMLFRPPEYLDDVRERELEIKSMEERLARRDLFCPVCRAEVDSTYLVCPVCTTKLPCSGHMMRRRWAKGFMPGRPIFCSRRRGEFIHIQIRDSGWPAT